MKRNELPSQEYLQSVLAYDETSESCLRWINPNARRVKVGDRAGYLKTDSRNGYTAWVVYVKGVAFQSSNVIYKLVYGTVPENGFVIDHINRISTDNRLENMRLISVNGNNTNRSLNKKITSTNFSGVSLNKNSNKYTAYGNVPEKGRVILGYYCNIDDAIFIRACHMLEHYREYCAREIEQIKTQKTHIYTRLQEKFELDP